MLKNNCKCADCHDCSDCISGSNQEEGTYICKNCGQKVYLESIKSLPSCPRCGNQIFTKL